MTTYGISHTDALNSCWYVVDAVNSDCCFEIVFSDDPDLQKRIAEGSSQVSTAYFGCCTGAIDGIHIWIHKPSMKDCLDVDCSSGKIFSWRKKKFGLNYQAVCDVRGNKILDLSILLWFDFQYLAFEGSSLFQKLENSLLAP
jgi:hypothetical protein